MTHMAEVLKPRQRFKYRAVMTTRRRFFRRDRPKLLVLRANNDEATTVLTAAYIAGLFKPLSSIATLILSIVLMLIWGCVLLIALHNLAGWPGLATLDSLSMAAAFNLTMVGICVWLFALMGLRYSYLLLLPFGVEKLYLRRTVRIRANAAPTGVDACIFIVPDPEVADGMRHAVYNSPSAHRKLAAWITSLNGETSVGPHLPSSINEAHENAPAEAGGVTVHARVGASDGGGPPER
jgi:hypothetical protein